VGAIADGVNGIGFQEFGANLKPQDKANETGAFVFVFQSRAI